MKHRIQVETAAFNERRYGKPWIAKVDFSKSTEGEFIWGSWVGDARNGTAGMLEVEAETGAIIATGQKDLRKPRNSAPEWFQVSAEGKLLPLATKAEALKEFRNVEGFKRAEELAKPSDPTNAAGLALDALLHAAEVAEDNNQTNRAAFFHKMAIDIQSAPQD